MWQSILFSNNDLIFLRSLDSERRKRQHLKNQVQWYGRRESKHLRSAYNDRSRVHQPMFGERHNALLLLSKPPQRRFSGAAAHDFGSLHRKRKAPEVSPRQCVRDRSRMAETVALFTIARRRSRNAHYLFMSVLISTSIFKRLAMCSINFIFVSVDLFVNR